MERPFYTLAPSIVYVIALALTPIVVHVVSNEYRYTLGCVGVPMYSDCRPHLHTTILNIGTAMESANTHLTRRCHANNVYTYSPTVLKQMGVHYLRMNQMPTMPSFDTLDWSRQISIMNYIDKSNFRKTRRKRRGGRQKIKSVTNIFARRPDPNNGGVNVNNLIGVQLDKRKDCLPSVIMGNARSLNNKIDELAAMTKYINVFSKSCIMCFTETWFLENMTNDIMSIDGFSVHRGDRNLHAVNKHSGGGVCVYVNDKWCHVNNVHKKLQECTSDLEILILSMRPHYIPREFSHVIVACVYIPCKANTQTSLNLIASHIHDIETLCPDAFIIISGDFNNRTLSKVLPNYKQHVKCKTRDENTIDLCYTKIKDAYTSSRIAPLGRSDHNLIHLCPEYIPLVRRDPPKTIQVKLWTEEAIEKLNDCFENTIWSTFIDSSRHINELTVTVCDYINFCVENCVLEKSVTIYQNNKPWLTKRIKMCIKEKHKAFRTKDHNAIKASEKNLRREIRKGKREYKNNLEEKFEKGNAKELWEGMGKMTGYQNKNKKNQEASIPKETDPEQYANDLNNFYARFDCHDFTKELSELKSSLNNEENSTNIEFEEYEVKKAMRKINCNKGAGPDGVHPKVLKNCYNALSFIITHLFNASLKSCTVPEIWKTSHIIPVPKKAVCNEMNDLRPIAMTSTIMKTFERLLLGKLRPSVIEYMDPLQFAYQSKRGVEDAILYVLNEIYKNLEHQGSYVRLMFFDFSSAFNTIQPHILGKKLREMNVDANTVLWVIDYLCHRPQYVRMSNLISNVVITNTGAPQGTVLSPFLFSLYTSDYRVAGESCRDVSSCTMVKYADDTSLCGFIKNGDERSYRESVDNFESWCERNYLLMNVTKTKEMVIDFRKNKNLEVDCKVEIKSKSVERVQTYKYLGVLFDENLSWTENTTSITKKCQGRLYFLRKLNSFKASQKTMCLFYQSVIQSIITFCALCWGGNLKTKDRDRLNSIISKGEKIIKENLTHFEAFLSDRDQIKMKSITNDESHPLWSEFESRKLKSGRYRVPKINSSRYHDTFIPRSILGHNKKFKR